MTDDHVNIFYSDEDGGYIADIPDLDSCSAFGETTSDKLLDERTSYDQWRTWQGLLRLSNALSEAP
jgi:hypothetical protein